MPLSPRHSPRQLRGHWDLYREKGQAGGGWGAPSDQPAGGTVSLSGQKGRFKGFPLEKMKIELKQDRQTGGPLRTRPSRSGGCGPKE